MATWFTADLHFGHRNIIEYCNRPFSDVDDMTTGLVDRWNERVAADDDVWVLGDVAMGRIAESLPAVARLHGHKHLVAGNHDRCWFGHGERSADWIDRYREVGFETIVQGTARTAIGSTEVTLCHFPYEGDSHGMDRFVQHRPVDDGGWLVHGHVHDSFAQRGRQINVGIDAHDLAPVTEALLAEWIAAGPADRDPD